VKNTVGEWPVASDCGVMMTAGKADLKELPEAGGRQFLQLGRE
jgi:hypothetical protein